MSLFENDEYRWRETYFVLIEEGNRPSGKALQDALVELGGRYQVGEPAVNEGGLVESLTLYSPDDNSAMDVTYLEGEEVIEQRTELADELKQSATNDEERAVLDRLPSCNARLDVYHFEQVNYFGDEDEEEEFLDPGSLLIVLERLAELCGGIAIDPQTGSPLP